MWSHHGRLVPPGQGKGVLGVHGVIPMAWKQPFTPTYTLGLGVHPHFQVEVYKTGLCVLQSVPQ